MIPVRMPEEAPKVAPAPIIALVRLAALECRAGPRHALQACAVLDPLAPPEDYIVALVRALQGAADRRMVFWRPGATGLSFDETWLSAVALASADGDADSLRFLLTRRLRPGAIPVVRLLMRGVMERLALEAVSLESF